MRISDWSSDVCSSDLLADKGGTATGGMPMNTEVHSAGYTLKGDIMLSNRDTLRLGSEFRHQWLNDYWPAVAGHMMMGPNTYINVNGAKSDRIGTFGEWEAKWTTQLPALVRRRKDQCSSDRSRGGDERCRKR